MGLAPFFEKTALAGSQLLQDFDAGNFARLLESHVVQVAFDTAAIDSSEGRITLDLTVNLLSRLYPRLLFTLLNPEGERDGKAEVDALVEQARLINPNIDILGDPSMATLRLVVGSTLLPSLVPTFYLGSNGWIAGFSAHTPVGSGKSTTPFGAAAVACWGVANLFRVTFSEQLKGALPDNEWRISLLDLDQRGDALPNPSFDSVDIGESHLVGAGAIGNAAIWALARAPFVEGTLHIIDNEAVDDTNPQRYLLANIADIGIRKVTLAKRHLELSKLGIESHDQTWSEYLLERQDWIFDRLIVALDTPEDRCAVQTTLPRRILNAWTQPDDLGVSRHGFADGQACLMCLYLPEGPVPDMDDQILRALHLPEDDKTLRAVRHLLVTGEPIGVEWIQRIALANRIPAERLMELQALPIMNFYQKAICGGVLLALGASDAGAPKNSEVPMAFQSALAGILLAAELVADSVGLRDTAPVTTKINLLRPLGQDLSLPAPQHPSGQCICQDADYVTVYRKKYRAI